MNKMNEQTYLSTVIWLDLMNRHTLWIKIIESTRRFQNVIRICLLDSIPSIHPHSLAGWWRFPGVLHCHDGKADCSDVLYIFSVRMSVYHVTKISTHNQLSRIWPWALMGPCQIINKMLIKDSPTSNPSYLLFMYMHRECHSTSGNCFN